MSANQFSPSYFSMPDSRNSHPMSIRRKTMAIQGAAALRRSNIECEVSINLRMVYPLKLFLAPKVHQSWPFQKSSTALKEPPDFLRRARAMYSQHCQDAALSDRKS